MNFFGPNLSQDDVSEALEQACWLGWLEKVPHGYCFSCHSEKMVFDILDPEAPVQPPKCAECFTSQAQKMIKDNPGLIDEIMAEIEAEE